MDVDRTDWITVAVLVPVASLFAVSLVKGIGRLARWIGRRIAKGITRSFAETVRDVVAPDLARMGTRLGQSVDELRQQNAREHAVTSVRLQDVDRGIAELGDRLTALEDSLLRPPESRTRSTDDPEGN